MGTDDSREAVLSAARAAFHARGYARTTMKGVAMAAGVAPSVLRKYYDSKEQMFAAAMQLPFDPASAVPTLIGPGLEGMGERLVRATFEILGDEEIRGDLVELFQAGSAAGQAASSFREFFEDVIVDRVASMAGVPDARMRAAVISSHLVGLSVTRFVIRLEPLASAPEEQVVRMYAPLIQELLDPTVPVKGMAAPSREARMTYAERLSPPSDQ